MQNTEAYKLVCDLLMEIRRANLRAPISNEAQAVYSVLCAVQRKMEAV